METQQDEQLQEQLELETATDLELDEFEIDERPNWLVAVRAAEDKKATNIKVLDLREVTSFTDFFVICNGSNPKQIQAISDEIQMQLKARREYASGIEGYETGEWILGDYVDLIVHVFNEKTREFYDLDRLWRDGKEVEIPVEAPVETPAE